MVSLNGTPLPDLRFTLRRKATRGQALLELMGVIPGFLLFLSILVFSGWWTYGRINTISRNYFLAVQTASSNQPGGMQAIDNYGVDLTTGRPYWDHTDNYSSWNIIPFYQRFLPQLRLSSIVFQGAISLVDFSYTDGPAPGEAMDYGFSPIPSLLDNFGGPQSTLPGSFCLYCSDALGDSLSGVVTGEEPNINGDLQVILP